MIGNAMAPNGVEVFDTPTLTVEGKTGKRREYNVRRMADLLRPFVGVSGDLMVMIERVHAMPGQGVRSMFTMGYGSGVWVGLLAGLSLPYQDVTPQRWKKALLDGMGKEKDAARFKAQQMFPKAELHLVKHHGRAEALLIAEYLRRTSAPMTLDERKERT